MARKHRIHYPGAFYHVILRGNAGAPVFFTDYDRLRLYLILQYAVEKFGCRIHGFCLMTNHIHLIMQVGDLPLSRIMQNVSLRYTKWINSSQGRTGHVFQGRYKALLVDADTYLLELVRYVHLNPVRAGVAESAAVSSWTGHRGYMGTEVIPWLSTDWVLGMLSPAGDNARRTYLSFVNDGITEERREEFHSGTCEGRLLGNDCFIDAILSTVSEERQQVTVSDVLAAVCAIYDVQLAALRAPGKVRPFTEARAVASLLVQEFPHLSQTQLARELNRDVAPLGRVGRRLKIESDQNEHVQKMINRAREKLAK